MPVPPDAGFHPDGEDSRFRESSCFGAGSPPPGGAAVWALSTRWNARRHTDGAALTAEIREAGYEALELSYDLTRDLVPGIRAGVERGDVRVVSVHNYCPVPMGVPRGHPELFTFADPDPRRHAKAIEATAATVRFAAELGARVVVVHAGYVRMRAGTPRLNALIRAGREGDRAFERARARLDRRRERHAPRALERVRAGLEALAPLLDETGVKIGLENLPFWEAVPSEIETLGLVETLGAERVGYWHDIGHGHLREGLGFIHHARLFERLAPCTLGLHIHDARRPDEDHLLPGEGEVDFAALAPVLGGGDWLRVVEPRRDAAPEALRAAREQLETLFTPPQDRR